MSRLREMVNRYRRGLKVAGHPGESAFEDFLSDLENGHSEATVLRRMADYLGPCNDDVFEEAVEAIRLDAAAREEVRICRVLSGMEPLRPDDALLQGAMWQFLAVERGEHTEAPDG